MKGTESIVNKPAVVLLTAVAMAIGITPYTLFIGQPWLAIIVALIALLLSLITFRSFTSPATEQPRPLEFLLGGVSVLMMPTVVSLMGFISWWLLHGVIWLVGHMLAWLGAGIKLPTREVAFWGSMVCTAFFMLGTTHVSVKTLARNLYPQAAGLRSVFYSLITHGLRQLLTIMVAAITVLAVLVGAAAVRGEFDSSWFNLGLMFLFIIVASPLQRLGKEKISQKAANVIKAVGKLFTARGYNVIPSPRTEDPNIDPLLVTVDFYVNCGKSAYAVDVLTTDEIAQDSEYLEIWQAVSDVQAAALALTNYSHETGDEPPLTITPLVVVVGIGAHEFFRSCAEYAKVDLVTIEDVMVDEILRADGEELAEMAHQHLRFLGDTSAGEDGESQIGEEVL